MASHLVGGVATNPLQVELSGGHHPVGLGESLRSSLSEEISAGFGMDRYELTNMLGFELVSQLTRIELLPLFRQLPCGGSVHTRCWISSSFEFLHQFRSLSLTKYSTLNLQTPASSELGQKCQHAICCGALALIV